ncbi:hypothetical protein PWG14_14110 (plasmid) [Chromobacterium amazonense]|uniref:hypothetical protein n=1 Tax=Chromobacterium amazonense TaxID=1382803 RepID=UPI00237D40CF|nr:hypothetical protein [Chromobacterium amazonense]MDE1713698.1 hypothetical protein [Chromobacterium amazonense]
MRDNTNFLIDMNNLPSILLAQSYVSTNPNLTVRVQSPANTPVVSAPQSQEPTATASSGESSVHNDYGISESMLQLIKHYDVKNISVDDLVKLTGLLYNHGSVDADSAGTIMAIQVDIGRSNIIDAKSLFNDKMDLVNDVVTTGRMQLAHNAIASYQGAQKLMQKLSALHDVLQKDDRIQEASAEALQQATDDFKTQGWISRMQQGTSEGHYVDQDWDRISGGLQRMGVNLSGIADSDSLDQKLNAAWQAYQAWGQASPHAPLHEQA